jgi:hypothetical protein
MPLGKIFFTDIPNHRMSSVVVRAVAGFLHP